MSTGRTRSRRDPRAEDGLGIIEVLIAGVLLIFASLAVLGLVGNTARSTYRAETSQVVANRLNLEMEQIRSLSYTQIALNATPGTRSTNTAIPSYRLNTARSLFNIASRTTSCSTSETTSCRPLVITGGTLQAGGTVPQGKVAPGPTSFTSGDVSGTIYRYVVWQSDPACITTTNTTGAQCYKRVIIAATINTTASGGTRSYQEIQADFVDPSANSTRSPG